jgi:hypothetical protein
MVIIFLLKMNVIGLKVSNYILNNVAMSIIYFTVNKELIQQSNAANVIGMVQLVKKYSKLEFKTKAALNVVLWKHRTKCVGALRDILNKGYCDLSRNLYTVSDIIRAFKLSKDLKIRLNLADIASFNTVFSDLTKHRFFLNYKFIFDFIEIVYNIKIFNNHHSCKSINQFGVSLDMPLVVRNYLNYPSEKDLIKLLLSNGTDNAKYFLSLVKGVWYQGIEDIELCLVTDHIVLLETCLDFSNFTVNFRNVLKIIVDLNNKRFPKALLCLPLNLLTNLQKPLVMYLDKLEKEFKWPIDAATIISYIINSLKFWFHLIDAIDYDPNLFWALLLALNDPDFYYLHMMDTFFQVAKSGKTFGIKYPSYHQKNIINIYYVLHHRYYNFDYCKLEICREAAFEFNKVFDIGAGLMTKSAVKK